MSKEIPKLKNNEVLLLLRVDDTDYEYYLTDKVSEAVVKGARLHIEFEQSDQTNLFKATVLPKVTKRTLT